MNLKEKLQALDQMILEGQILPCIDRFFHPEVETQEGNENPVIGKAAHRAKLEQFFAGISAVNAIKLHNQAVGEDVTMSEFTFDLTQKDGSKILWNEVLRRKWKGGLVIHERYYTA